MSTDKVPPGRRVFGDNGGVVLQAARQTGRGSMRPGRLILLLCIAVGACASPLPPPNSIRTSYERSGQVIQVYISNAQMPHDAWLIDANGARYPLPLTLVSGPHVNYSEPPSLGLGLGVFGWNVGGGTGVGIPLGSPRPISVDDQFIASARFAAPADYPQRWAQYRIVAGVGPETVEAPAPAPS